MGEDEPAGLPRERGDLLQARWTRDVAAPVDRLWDAVAAFGGAPGYYGAAWIWRARADLDALLGGPGRGPERPARPLRPGDLIGLWRVESVDPGARLVLRARSRMPGTAWLEALTCASSATTSRLDLRQPFLPSGPLGHVYWRAERPGHHLVYARMASAMARAAEAAARA